MRGRANWSMWPAIQARNNDQRETVRHENPWRETLIDERNALINVTCDSFRGCSRTQQIAFNSFGFTSTCWSNDTFVNDKLYEIPPRATYFCLVIIKRSIGGTRLSWDTCRIIFVGNFFFFFCSSNFSYRKAIETRDSLCFVRKKKRHSRVN